MCASYTRLQHFKASFNGTRVSHIPIFVRLLEGKSVLHKHILDVVFGVPSRAPTYWLQAVMLIHSFVWAGAIGMVWFLTLLCNPFVWANEAKSTSGDSKFTLVITVKVAYNFRCTIVAIRFCHKQVVWFCHKQAIRLYNKQVTSLYQKQCSHIRNNMEANSMCYSSLPDVQTRTRNNGLKVFVSNVSSNSTSAGNLQML